MLKKNCQSKCALGDTPTLFGGRGLCAGFVEEPSSLKAFTPAAFPIRISYGSLGDLASFNPAGFEVLMDSQAAICAP